MFCDVSTSAVISAIDAGSLYDIPLLLHEEGLDAIVCETLGIDLDEYPIDLALWEKVSQQAHAATKTIQIGLVGKYVTMPDAYLSVYESILHAGFGAACRIEVQQIDAEFVPSSYSAEFLDQLDGIIIPGGFGERGVEGMIETAKIARERDIPTLGICLGMQVMVIETARHQLGMVRANSTEFDSATEYPVIDLMSEQMNVTDKGGTMRLGAYPAMLTAGSIVSELYESPVVSERHRHRYEFNARFKQDFEKVGMVSSGLSPDGRLVEFVELNNHPYFVGTQAHPEFKSRPNRPHPLFAGLVAAAINRHDGRENRIFNIDTLQAGS
jgi:CTP synthase